MNTSSLNGENDRHEATNGRADCLLPTENFYIKLKNVILKSVVLKCGDMRLVAFILRIRTTQSQVFHRSVRQVIFRKVAGEDSFDWFNDEFDNRIVETRDLLFGFSILCYKFQNQSDRTTKSLVFHKPKKLSKIFSSDCSCPFGS